MTRTVLSRRPSVETHAHRHFAVHAGLISLLPNSPAAEHHSQRLETPPAISMKPFRPLAICQPIRTVPSLNNKPRSSRPLDPAANTPSLRAVHTNPVS